MIGVAVIGGGVVGCCLALELSPSQRDIYVFEKNPAIGKGENQSSRNSGVNHAGIYYDKETRPLKAALCAEGNVLWHKFCLQHDLPYKRTGKLMVAKSETESLILDKYLGRAIENGVPGVKKISGKQVRELEPNVYCHSALLVPSSGIFDPISLVYKVFALASNAGVQFLPQTEVIGIRRVGRAVEVRIRYRDGIEDSVAARWVINATGTRAVDVAKMIDADLPIDSALIRGDSLKFYRTRRQDVYLRGMNVYPTPVVVNTPSGRQHTVGIHLTPTLDKVNGKWVIGNTVTVGPQLVPVGHFEDYQTPTPAPQTFLTKMAFFPGLGIGDLEPHQTGVQARLNDYHDYYIKRDRVNPQVIHLAGIDSPGFTSAPAIARYVSRIINEKAA